MGVRTASGIDAGGGADFASDSERDFLGWEARLANGAQARRTTPKSAKLRVRALIVADLFGLLGASVLVGSYVAFSRDATLAETALGVLLFALVSIPLWSVCAGASGLYRRDEQRADLTVTDDVLPVFVIATLVGWLILLLFILASNGVPSDFLIGLWASVILLVLASRAITRTRLRLHPEYRQNTLIVGAGEVGQLLGRKLEHHPELGLRLLGFVDDDPRSMRLDLQDMPILGPPGKIRELVTDNDVERVVISFSNERHDQQLDLVHELRDLNVQIDLVPRLFEAIGPVVQIHYVEGLPLVGLPIRRSTHAARAMKRAIDVFGALVGLTFLSPLFLVVAWMIKRDSPGPVLFRQERLGQDMTRFEMLKFRTMKDGTSDDPHQEYVRSIMETSATPAQGSLYKLDRPDAVTKTGAWLRRSSLDELPQLINVLRGEMSLVGPRPCLAYECDAFEPHHFDRFLVPAGMTGLWQVTARARTTFKEALDLDVAYARNWSLGLDLKLVLRTPLVLFRRRATA